MYSNADLFLLAQEQEKPVFLGNVTASIPDDAEGCVDLGAETNRLSRFWDVSRMSVNQLVSETGMSKTAFAKGVGIPLRTLQNWCLGERACPTYLRFLIAEHYGLI